MSCAINTSYIKNNRNSNKFLGCGPLQLSCDLTEKCLVVAIILMLTIMSYVKKDTDNETIFNIIDFFDFSYSL